MNPLLTPLGVSRDTNITYLAKWSLSYKWVDFIAFHPLLARFDDVVMVVVVVAIVVQPSLLLGTRVVAMVRLGWTLLLRVIHLQLKGNSCELDINILNLVRMGWMLLFRIIHLQLKGSPCKLDINTLNWLQLIMSPDLDGLVLTHWSYIFLAQTHRSHLISSHCRTCPDNHLIRYSNAD